MEQRILTKKKVLKGNVTRLLGDIGKDGLDSARLELYDQKCSKFNDDLIEIFDAIYEVCKADEVDAFTSEQQSIQENVDEIWIKVKRKRAELETPQNNNSNIGDPTKGGPVPAVGSEVRLPRISLASFGGKMEDWVGFKDLFMASVHKNANLSPSQKLSYLKSSLHSEAARIISAISISDNNYDTAWGLLEDRFSNKKDQVFAYLKKFLSIAPIQNESPSAILNVVDTVNECVRSLEILEQKIEGFSQVIFAYLLIQKLDPATKLWFQREVKAEKEQLPQLSHLLSFLREHARALSASKENVYVKRNAPKLNAMVSGVNQKNERKCASCRGNHGIHACYKFLNLSVRERIDLIKKLRLCFCCFLSHGVKSCPTAAPCKLDGGFHNKLLCYRKEKEKQRSPSFNNEKSKNETFPSNAEASVSVVCENPDSTLNANATPFRASANEAHLLSASAHSNSHSDIVILATAAIQIKGSKGNAYVTRALLDSGSAIHCCTNKLVDRLALPRRRVDMTVTCLSGAELPIKWKTKAMIADKRGNCLEELELLIVDKISSLTPSRCIDISKLSFPVNIEYADDSFSTPGEINLLIGAAVFFKLLRPGQFYIPNSSLVLQNTMLGFVLSGSISDVVECKKMHCGVVFDGGSLNDEVKKFWEIEQVPERGLLRNPEEIKCNDHFVRTHKRNHEGRFVVEMPLCKDVCVLGDSKQIALKRLNSLWFRLARDPKLLSLYRNFLKEYVDLGHMEEVFETNEPSVAYYLPHLPVYHLLKDPEKIRVVFDGSQVTTSGESLNSIQLNGGPIQEHLFSIVLRFRLYVYAFTADVCKMYRMISLVPSQCNLQRIVWKDELDSEIRVFRLTTVTYGLKSSSYIAMRCLQQLADDCEKQFPTASEVVRTSFYMDDVLTGASDFESAKKLQEDLVTVLGSCGMLLHKWHSNHPGLIPSVASSDTYVFESSGKTKALGLHWNPKSDIFSFHVSCPVPPDITKRGVLSTISKIFDPLGIAAPVITKAKIFLQSMWRLQLDWDEPLPQCEAKQWLNFCDSLPVLNDLKIPRFVLSVNPVQTAIYGFSDASEVAYGAALYAICVSENQQISSKLLCSKSRVSPIKTVTIPRLELCAAVLLAKLAYKVSSVLSIPNESNVFFTDSSIVLCWLKKSPADLKMFVASRVAAIQSLTDVSQWRHVSSHNNPADLVSRGLDPGQLVDNNLWRGGDICSKVPTINFNCDYEPVDDTYDPYACEIKTSKGKNSASSSFSMVASSDDHTLINDLLNMSNNYYKILRVFSYVLRFVNACRTKACRPGGPITPSEMAVAESRILKAAQVPLCGDGKRDFKGNLLSLNPYLDDVGILRVGGRLGKATLPHEHKHPAILPKNSKLSHIIFKTMHQRLLHVGPQGLLNAVRLKYWPLGGRNLARKIVHSCIVCFRAKPLLSSQIMGDLPSERITPSPAFHFAGLDLCGPYYVAYKNQRRGVLNKVYICICICMITRAIHLEMLSDLTSDALIATLKRFFARRGKCAKIYTDCATNFVGANTELKKLFRMVNFPDENLAAFFAAESVDWNFIPPKSPHQGGIWEAGVKSVKYHLRRIMGKQRFTYEEFETIIIQIEGILNSRPLTPLTADDDSYEVLTPGHFLIGRSISAIIEPQLVDVNENRLSRWQRATKVVQAVWRKWKNDYLSTLQQRSRWMVAKENITVGIMVIVKEDYLPCCKWLLGRITKVYFGADGKVRVVKVRTPTGELKRPIQKIAILPIEQQVK